MIQKKRERGDAIFVEKQEAGCSQAHSTTRKSCNHRNPEMDLIFHSGRGSQYTAYQFQQRLYERSVQQSFSNSGRPHDTAAAESFFATLKKGDFYRRDLQI